MPEDSRCNNDDGVELSEEGIKEVKNVCRIKKAEQK
jgi:hypothetical protein